MKNPTSVSRSAGGETAWPTATLLRAALLLAAAMGIASCGGGGSTEPVPPPPPPPPPPAPVAPQQVGTIPNQTIATGQTTTLDVVSYFNDPDGGALTYTVSSSAAGVVSVSMSASTLTLVGVADGLATVTVTATDPDGLSAAQGFQVTVETPNRAPEAVGTIPSLAMAGPGQTETVDVSPFFSDPDGDALTYTASSSAAGVVSVSMSAATLTIVGVAEGTATVTVTAADPDGLTATQGFQVTVVAPIPLSERGVLEALFRATGGGGWINAEHWLTDAPLSEWYGVSVDDQGAVVGLHLARNDLAGPIPSSLAGLSSLEWLHLGDNELTGPIPPQLGGLANLRELVLVRNNLAGPIPASLGSLSELRRLDLLAAGVTGPIPPNLGRLTNLEELRLHGNRLSGSIPPELGDLVNLRVLSVGGSSPSQLTGRIPSELGQLINLERLQLFWTGLTGPVPPELGNLRNLRELQLHGNELTGPIPPQLGRLASLEELYLPWNSLAGPIPPELGDLARLRWLALNDNALTGPIPQELGDLAALEQLYLSANDLTGGVPPEFGGLLSLRELLLSDNSEMSGSLPATLTRLTSLEALQTHGTGLCAPSDADFLAWLQTVPNQRAAVCGVDSGSFYLVQAVQSRQFPVALVADEEALLRVFVTAERENNVGRPPVRASFYLDGALAEAVGIPGGAGPVPISADESSLTRTANAVIAGALIRPGLEVVVEIDPDGTLPRELGITKRIPETGRAPVDVRGMPLLDLTLLPFLWTQDPDSAVLAAVGGMVDDPAGHELLRETHTLLPVGDLRVSGHEPVLSSSRDAHDLLDQTSAIRVMEGGAGHYMGLMSGLPDEVGLAQIADRASFSVPDSRIMAHELGHNLSLLHTSHPPPVDLTYPHAQGTTGAWGYSHDDEKLVPPDWYDLMSYSSPGWISDYHFSKALRFRLADEAGRAATGSPGESLLLWGGVDAAGAPYLEPAFVVDAPVAPPPAGGEYRIVGADSEGRVLFSFRFGMLEIADGDGSSSFAFVLPVRAEWRGSLSTITLTGPGGRFTLDGESDFGMAILRNPRTGQVRGFLRDLTVPPSAAMAAAEVGVQPGLELLFSRGIPDASPWRR